ncbi:MAG: hypothetical protein R2681_11375 [Pyrinomonadaceae bacterium]
MSSSAFFLLIAVFVSNLFSASCAADPVAETKLPKTMPENTMMKWSENGGMAPAWKKIEVSGDQILFEVKKMSDEEPVEWTASISAEEKSKLYQVFVENKFDTIENDETDEITYDAGSEGVYIRAGSISKNVSYGENSPLSGLNEKRYLAVAKAIQNLEAKNPNSSND